MDYSNTIEIVKSKIALVFSLDSNGKISNKGSGFVFSKKGILVTCNHVIRDGVSVKIRFFDKDEIINAEVAIRDEEHDLAILKFEDNVRDPLEQADVNSIKEGMPVIFSGYPLSMISLTTHQGILSAIIKDATGVTTYLIDGTVNSGNSGCPLMTREGRVIGVVNAKRREKSDLLGEVEEMTPGAISLHGIDIVKIYQALIENVQLGIGYAIPCSYIPEHRDPRINFKDNKKNSSKKL